MLSFLIYIFQTFTVNTNKFRKKVKSIDTLPPFLCWFSIKGCLHLATRSWARKVSRLQILVLCSHVFIRHLSTFKPQQKALEYCNYLSFQWLITDNQDRYRHAPLFDLCTCRCSSVDYLWTVTLHALFLLTFYRQETINNISDAFTFLLKSLYA